MAIKSVQKIRVASSAPNRFQGDTQRQFDNIADKLDEILVYLRTIVLPKMTTSQRNGLRSLEEGTLIYNTTTAQFEGYSAGAWVAL